MAFDITKHGIEKIVLKATAGDVEFAGKDIAIEGTDEMVIEYLLVNNAKGSKKLQGNNKIDFNFKDTGTSKLAAVLADAGNENNIEIWQQGSTSADHTITKGSLLPASQNAAADPEGLSGIVYNVYRVGA